MALRMVMRATPNSSASFFSLGSGLPISKSEELSRKRNLSAIDL
jgi:hypothetical protein